MGIYSGGDMDVNKGGSMKTIAMVLALLSICAVGCCEIQSIDSIEKQVLRPYGGRNVEGRNCVTRAREAETLLTANGYTWREKTHDMVGIHDGEIGGSHMYVEVKTAPTIFYPDGWVTILDTWPF